MTDGAAVDLVLASASPRRRELLGQLGLVLEVTPANVDETPHPGERPADYVRRVAAAKCDAVAQARAADLPAVPVVAADTIVIVDDQILGQPTDEADARADAARARGPASRRHHRLPHPLRRPDGGPRGHDHRSRSGRCAPPRSTPTSRPASGGARPAATRFRASRGVFASELRGSHTNVIGLPLAELLADLQALEALPRYPPAGFGARSDT